MRKSILLLFLCVSLSAFLFISCGKGPGGKGGNKNTGGQNAALTFNIEITGKTATTADVQITPSNDEAFFHYGIMTKEKYEEQKERFKEEYPSYPIFGLDTVAYGRGKKWKEHAEEAGYYNSGVVSFNIAKDRPEVKLEPETEFVVYCYFISKTSEKPDSEVFEVFEKTEQLNVDVIELKKGDVVMKSRNLTFTKDTQQYSVEVKVELNNDAEGKSFLLYAFHESFFNLYVHSKDRHGNPVTNPKTNEPWTPLDGIKRHQEINPSEKKPIYTADGRDIKIEKISLDPNNESKKIYLVLALYDDENGIISKNAVFEEVKIK